MALNYPTFVVLTSHFRTTFNPNPVAQTLQAEDQQLFAAFNALAVQAMAQAQLSSQFLPHVVLLASMSPGNAPQRVQLATLFVRNALFVLNQAVPPVANVVARARRTAPVNLAAGPQRPEAAPRAAKKAPPTKKARIRKKTGAVRNRRALGARRGGSKPR